jgi:hypothetical protein
LALFASLFSLVACMAIATPVITPSGEQGFDINCTATNIGMCYKRAGELCGSNGYEIFNQNNEMGGFFTKSNQSMVIKCKTKVQTK